MLLAFINGMGHLAIERSGRYQLLDRVLRGLAQEDELFSLV
jgi:hypothetical protein